MSKIMIFGGTTEGRQLSEYLSHSKVAHIVSVTSDYGHSLIAPNEYTEVLTGRMDRDAISDFLGERNFTSEDIVVDATHPYATLASSNIKAAVTATGCRLIHIKRSDANTDGKDRDGDIRFYDDAGACFKALDHTEGNILLTTGSKELAAFRDTVSDDTLHRTYVRVIPSADSMDICAANGIEPSRIIAMQGPFGVRMNEAVIDQYEIAHLATKQSGTAGGYEDKLKACSNMGITCHVIRRPAEDEGVSVYEAYCLITGENTDDAARFPKGYGSNRIIWLTGAGMGSRRTLTEEAASVIHGADAVFGAGRLIEPIRAEHKYPLYLAQDIIKVLDDHPEYVRIAILFSGDSGFYSGAGSVGRKLSEWDPDVRIRILPGISSVSYLAALSGENYDDAAIFSLHGRNTAQRFHALTEMIGYNRKTYVLLSGDEDVRELGLRLDRAGMDCDILIGQDMSYESEEVISLTPREAMRYESESILTALVINRGYERRPLIKVLDDDELIRDRVPMTKECVRHECVIRLGLREGDIVYDIGGGTGSVALEAASVHPSIRVYTVERDRTAVELIRQNICRMRMDNVILTEGEAPEALSDLETPDAVFIGGSGGRLREILESIHARGTGIRYVVTSVSLETSGELNTITEEQGIKDVRIIQMQVSDVKTVGSHHMMQANNPVMIYSFIW